MFMESVHQNWTCLQLAVLRVQTVTYPNKFCVWPGNSSTKFSLPNELEWSWYRWTYQQTDEVHYVVCLLWFQWLSVFKFLSDYLELPGVSGILCHFCKLFYLVFAFSNMKLLIFLLVPVYQLFLQFSYQERWWFKIVWTCWMWGCCWLGQTLCDDRG